MDPWARALVVAVSKVGDRMKWLPTSETLPHYGEDVITFQRDIGLVTTGERTHTDQLGDHWKRCDGYGTRSTDNYKPTHWMPLPAPPSEDSDGRS